MSQELVLIVIFLCLDRSFIIGVVHGKLSYTSCREIIRDALKKLGFNPKD